MKSNIKLLFWFIILQILSFHFSFTTLAEAPKNYSKGKFYSSVKDNFLIATEKMTDNRFKTYKGEIESVASRVDAQTRSILTRVKIKNENSELIPGSLLEIQIRYNERDALSIPDTSVMNQGTKKFVYKVLENSTVDKIEVTTGTRYGGNIEILSGLVFGDKVVAEGLTKVRPKSEIKPIIKSK